MDEKDGMKKKDRDVPTDPNLLTAPSVLTGPGADAPPVSSRETSNGSSATEGGDGLGARDCGDCPSCQITLYLRSHDNVVTEVVHIAEGVWLGPTVEAFNPTTFEVLGDTPDAIATIAIERDNELAQAWWRGQKALAVLSMFGLLDED